MLIFFFLIRPRQAGVRKPLKVVQPARRGWTDPSLVLGAALEFDLWPSQASCKSKCSHLACLQFPLSLPLPYMCRWLSLGHVSTLLTHLLVSV